MSEPFSSPDLLDEFVMGNAQGGKKKALGVQVSVGRELTRADLEALIDGGSPANPQANSLILKIRNSHHQLARHIASGTQLIEVSAITGYTVAYISNLKNDPAFRELLEYYEKQKEAIFVDTTERAKAVSIAALEELQERIDQAPETFKHRELMELATLGNGLGPRNAPSSPAASGGGITITFVTPEPAAQPMIDITPSDEDR